MSNRETVIMARGIFLRVGQIEMSVREDGGLTILFGPQRLELDQPAAEIVAFMMRVISR